MATTDEKIILSGVQQSTFATYEEARANAVQGKLLFARVTGNTEYGLDIATGKMVEGAGSGITYVFLGKKPYGSMPQVPADIIKSLGLSIGEVNGGVVSCLTDYYTSSSITEILKEIAMNNGNVISPSQTVIVSNSADSRGVSATTVDVNIDNVSIVSAETGELSVASSAISAVTDVKIQSASSAVMSASTAITTGANSAVTVGLTGGTDGQVIKKSGTTYVWADPAGVSLSGLSGVTVSAGTAENGITPYNIYSNLYVSASTSSSTSGLARTYVLVDKDGNKYGQEIKTINDVFLKDVSATTSGGVKGLQFVWYVNNETGETPDVKTTFIPFTEFDSYEGGSGITIDQENNIVSVDLSTASTNILKFEGSGSASTLYASAITKISVDGTELPITDNAVSVSSLVSAVTTTVNSTENLPEFSGSVTTGGTLNLNIALSASSVNFKTTNSAGPLTGSDITNVQKAIDALGEAVQTESLTINVNNVEGVVYNPTGDAKTINIANVTGASIGTNAFTVTSAETGIDLSMSALSATNVSYTYTGSVNSGWVKTEQTADKTFEMIIDELANIKDNSISGLSAISATTNESGNTEISLTLNPSNTTSQAGGIISSEDGAQATGATLDGTTPTNAVKTSQDSEHGLFVYIEISGNDLDDEESTAYAITYTSNEETDTSNALGQTATKVG